jgi:hypothetical protein
MDNQSARIVRLVTAASKLLIMYEEELTAYHLVIRAAKKRVPPTQWDFDASFRKVLRAPGLHAEAEAEYAELEPLLHPISDIELPAALDRAASALERRLANYTK